MNRKLLLLLLLVPRLASAPRLLAQAMPTASRAADAQVGVGYSFGNPDYAPSTFRGISAWADLDLRPHLGAEFTFHQIGSTGGDGSFQRTYELGARYHREYGPLLPFLRASYGRGDFNYPYSITQLSYNFIAGAAGADVAIGQSLRVRVDYEYQNWFGFTNGGLHPQIVTFGVAYHVHGRPRYN